MAFLMAKRGSEHDRVICNLDNGSMGKKRHRNSIPTDENEKTRQKTSMNMEANYHII
jgi:hypothetical protein